MGAGCGCAPAFKSVCREGSGGGGGVGGFFEESWGQCRRREGEEVEAYEEEFVEGAEGEENGLKDDVSLWVWKRQFCFTKQNAKAGVEEGVEHIPY